MDDIEAEIKDLQNLESLPNSVVSTLTFSLPLVLNLMLEADTPDGGDFRIPIEVPTRPGSIVTISLIQGEDLNTSTLLVQTPTSTTPD